MPDPQEHETNVPDPAIPEGADPDAGPNGPNWEDQPNDMPPGRYAGSDHMVIDKDA